MILRVACPSCRSVLRVDWSPDQATEATCPRCLGRVPFDPFKAEQVRPPAPPPEPAPDQPPPPEPAPDQPPPPEPAPDQPPPAARRRPAECRECGEPLGPRDNYCPECGLPRRYGDRRRRPLPDVEARRDQRRISVGVILLAILGGLGLFGYLLQGVAVARQFQDPLMLLWALGVVGFTGLVVFLVTLARTQGEWTAFDFGRMAVNTLAVLGVLVIAGVGLTMAWLIFLFVVCTRAFSGH